MNVYHNKIHYKTVLKYFILFFAAALIFAVLIDAMLSDRIQEHLDAEKELATSTYLGIVSGYKAQADILFYNRINVPDVIALYRNAASASETERAEIRRRLYALLKPVYENIGLYHLKQLHFHLENSESFLRFHRPEKYGDNLTGIRDTVTYVNQTHQPVSGFEEGRIFNGFRFVYPLFDGNDYLGSAEVSISMQRILEMMRKDINADVNFIIRTQTVTSKVFKEEQKNYAPTELFPSYSHEKALSELCKPETKALLAEYIRRHGPLDKTLESGKAFNFYASDGETIRVLTFLPVVNGISKKSVAYIITDRRHDDIGDMLQQSRLITITITALLALLFYFLYRSDVQRHAIEMDKRQLQSLIDLQRNIVILTDSTTLKFANRYFYETFNYDSLKQFLAEHECICDLFIHDERYFHLGKVPAGQKWLAAMMETPATKRIVKMLDREGTPRIFTVAVNPIAGERYIVTFTDISLTIINQDKLEHQASRDSLTNAYNREFLDENFLHICHSAKAQKRLLGVTMVDLDHFKRINDTYGHNRGDDVLKQFVEIVRNAIRQEDFIVRWGGEEFLLLMMVDSINSLAAVTEGIRARIESAAFEEVGHITASFGVAIRRDEEMLTATVARTDKALYRAKASGRNTVIMDET